MAAKKDGNIFFLDDSPMTAQQSADKYRQITGHDPEPLTEEEKKEYGLK